MYLVQVLLPLYDNASRRIPRRTFEETAEVLTRRFGGLTAYTRAPVEGRWRQRGRRVRHDDLVIYEVMAGRLDRAWWRRERARLEKAFGQEVVVIRAQRVTVL